VKVATGDPRKRSYCSGLTYEVFLRAWRRISPDRIRDLTADDLRELRLRWNGDSTKSPERRRLVQHALTSMHLGQAVAKLENARPGDFVQFWRHSNSGHSAIFVNWVYEKDAIAGLTYWSSQSSTKGIGYRTEWIDDKGIKRDEIYLARARIAP
jgi:hypothetical protein